MSGSFLFEMTQFSVCSNPTPHTILGTCGLLLGDFFFVFGVRRVGVGWDEGGLGDITTGSGVEPDS